MSDTPDRLDLKEPYERLEEDPPNPIVTALGLSSDDELHIRLDALHPADFSDYLEEMTDAQREELIARAPGLITGELLAELEDDVVEDVLPLLEPGAIADALTELDSDDVTQIIEEMDEAQREDVLEAMEPLERAGVEASLKFDDETIGRLMQREFVSAPEFWTVGNTIDHMRDAGEELPELFFNIYIVNPRLQPVGYVPVSKLMRARRDATLASLMEEKLFTIAQDLDQEEAAYLFEKYHLISAPVVDMQGRIVGMMTVDDILDIIQDENKEDILALAGVSEAGITDTAYETVRSRAPWLLVNLVTAILASFVIARFDYAIEQIVALAVLMPIVASMGGNAGTQALTVAVRALAERDLTRGTALRTIRREAIAAVIIGLMFAVAMAGISFVWFRDIELAGVAFIAMIINHFFAGLAGILIPLGLKRAGADPAVSSSVFVTTVTDVVGFAAFLGVAAYVLL
ncbi:magnesium transporter [Algimonas porphyrae]|uniref:Magnesium transporter MgtE n=1 Tax=Algimonas porphyrae TaxID=1128113 RepID=A0ABQ5UZ29_9PROT|nr:magnesium transporter [Algimonas porphyrae]GLQ19694.1 magnesium transporter MgtE [Algimonas porphyrae]